MATQKKDATAKSVSSNTLEILLRKIGRNLADEQVCRFFKIPEEMKVTPCDFFGYSRTGRAILIEAKMYSATERLPIRKEGSKGCGIACHQLQELDDAQKAGAISLFVWQYRDAFTIFYPSTVISIMEVNNTRSVSVSNFVWHHLHNLHQCLKWIIEQISTQNLRQIPLVEWLGAGPPLSLGRSPSLQPKS